MKFLFLLVLFYSNFLFAGNENDQSAQMQKQIEEIMKHREEMLKTLFNDENFDQMEKRMLDMMKNFDRNDFDGSSVFGGNVVGEYNWREDENFKILSLKVKQIKDKPLDIKIEKGQINIKGDVEEVSKGKTKQVTKVHFERIFSIPRDVDEKNPIFDNKGGELLIKFKKNVIGKTKSKKLLPNDERTPVGPEKGDVAI